MKHDSHQNADQSSANSQNKHDNQQGGVLLTVLLVAACILAAVASIAAVVVTCRIHLEPPKDTEIGVIAVVATVTFYAILAQIGVTILQWHAAKGQLQVTDDALRHSRALERPHAKITSVWVDVKINKPIIPNISIQNQGRTPLENLKIFYGVADSEYGPPMNSESFASTPVEIPFLAPGDAPETFGIRCISKSYDGDLQSAITLNVVKLFVFGKGSYYSVGGTEPYALDHWAFESSEWVRIDSDTVRCNFSPSYSRASDWKRSESGGGEDNSQSNPN